MIIFELIKRAQFDVFKYLNGVRMSLDKKIDVVKDILKDKKVAIGFSGGADSTLMAYLSSKVAKDTLAITIDNHLFPKGFIENTKKLTQSFKINHEIIDINFYDDEYFLKNDEKRCFVCRKLMYTKIKEIAHEKGFDFICDGNNISDLVIDRPGILITYEMDFNTPFIEAKLTSKEIHQYLNDKNIPYSKSTTCLATRLPTNTKTTPQKIERIGLCEEYILSNTNCEIVKVRDLGELAIIEVDNIDEILTEDNFININDELKRMKFKKVTLNLSEIDDDEYIAIDYNEGSFTYQLPFSINIENTKKQLEDVIYCDGDKIQLENITIFENGLIEGHDFKNSKTALNSFMDILSKLRRNI